MNKNAIRCILIFIIISLFCSFSVNSFSLMPTTPVSYPSFDSYEEVMEAYYDNTKMWSFKILEDETRDSYWEAYSVLDFDEYCILYNMAIESESFLYFTEHSERLPGGIYFPIRRIQGKSIGCIIRYYHKSYIITVDFPLNEQENQAIKKGNIKAFIDMQDPDYFDGCQEKLTPTDSIILSGQKYKCFWVASNKVKIIYENKVITVLINKTEDGNSEVTQDYVREFISDLVFSAYIPPEDGGENATE